jgi:hypothetical protein
MGPADGDQLLGVRCVRGDAGPVHGGGADTWLVDFGGGTLSAYY